MPPLLPFSLDALRSHAIFVPPASTSDDGWELVGPQPSYDGLPALKNARLVVRDRDLIVAFGKEIRMTSLSSDGLELRGTSVGGYKTLKSPHLTFTIHQLVLNPTGRMLAVVGHHQLVVLVLPRAGLSGSAGGEIVCRSMPVDQFQHSPSSLTALTKVQWHPWGEGGNSLWVLASNGTLFEYDILHPQDPVQTFSLLPAETSRAKSKFSAIDPLSYHATSFTFGCGNADFAPLMVYGLMANGDIYTMGPVLPLSADVPEEYLGALQAFVAERMDEIDDMEVKQPGQEGSAEYASLVGRRQMQEAWVSAVVTQCSSDSEGEPSTPSTSPRRRGYGLPASPPRSERLPPLPGFVRVHPPHLTAAGGPAPGAHRPLARQGPLLFNPAPQEVGNGDDVDEQSATDLTILHAFGNVPEGQDPGLGINVLAIAWSSGRVDLGIEPDGSEPRWITSRDPAPTNPILHVVESVLSSFPTSDLDAIALNAPAFVKDPIQSDVVYISHAFGVDAVSVAPWVSQLLAGEGHLSPSDVAPLVKASPSKPVVGVETFCDVTLGYGLLALASSGQLATVEMDVRVPDWRLSAPKSAPVPDKNSESLLSTPFEVSLPGGDFNPKAAIRKAPDSHKALSAISPEHITALRDAAAQIKTRSRAVEAASAKVEARLDLQVKEYARQLAVLRQCAASTSALRSAAMRSTERAEAVLQAQDALGDRLDAVITALMAQQRPQIGAVERSWFDELYRVQARVNGARGAPGFAARLQVLKEQLEVVRPRVKAADAQAEEYGARQLRPLQAAVGSRGDELARLVRKMDALNVRVDGME
ncbi:hypothetical protein CC85DRAFT_287955 [Cutaneotrichosporon oleaginosum]|uniref:Uncharacterized protein n=1 Tax=Cutaneotrichosporon oleaginosum TaxID=879819 RepID=A0A0J0XFX3_9TREE|nr:uncharacterized protein CC85DRAFT_287955 [Cutaneotrichosporon oleaginosum]KLT39973.1 hypothetical protein CC85DRAFT_287955 [Cutaneotrichosporon oleaginosum]TXT14162.1 hypothetical protein COLE_00355 [Cutaneotrichosporon oleaginosum]